MKFSVNMVFAREVHYYNVTSDRENNLPMDATGFKIQVTMQKNVGQVSIGHALVLK